jgi:RHS repeat-associated protein
MYQKNILRMKRDAQSERIKSGYGDGSSTSFTYDSVNRLLQVYDSTSGLIQMGYDDLDRLTQELTPQGVVSYSYDAIGRRTSMTANGLTPVNYQYDNASRLTQVAQGSNAVDLAYDASGRRISLSYPNGTGTNYFYDNASRLSEILHQGPSGVIEDLLYNYDAAGNRLSFSRTNPQADLPQAVQAAYNAANQMTQFSTDTLTYDANGNLTFDGTNTYTWNARNRLVQMSSGSLLANFIYDALGRRVRKTINGATTRYLYDGNDIVAEIQYGAISATYLRSLNIDEPFLRASSVAEYYHTDALGSTLALTDQNGTVQTTYSYDLYGSTTASGISTNPFQYTGRENDGIGLFFYRSRYYIPTLQRFIAEDPIGFIGGLNLYGYVGNNPINFVDPFGLEKCPSFGDSFRFSLNTSNSFFFGFPMGLARTAIGITTAGATARSFGTVTPLQAVRSLGYGGVANLGIRGTIISAGINTGINSVLVAASLEAGIVVGSSLNAAFETLTCR